MSAPGDGYMTRGRAAAFERQLAAMQAAFDTRCDELQRQIDDLRAGQLEVPRALTGALLDVVRRNGAAGPAAVPDRRRGAGG